MCFLLLGKVRCVQAADDSESREAVACLLSPDRNKSGSSGRSTPTSGEADRDSFIIRKVTRVRTPKARDLPEYLKALEEKNSQILINLTTALEEKNRLMKERNELLREMLNSEQNSQYILIHIMINCLDFFITVC